MLVALLVQSLLHLLRSRTDLLRSAADRGDVAEKIVIVGVFVALAIAVGALITHAVTADANSIARKIQP